MGQAARRNRRLSTDDQGIRRGLRFAQPLFRVLPVAHGAAAHFLRTAPSCPSPRRTGRGSGSLDRLRAATDTSLVSRAAGAAAGKPASASARFRCPRVYARSRQPASRERYIGIPEPTSPRGREDARTTRSGWFPDLHIGLAYASAPRSSCPPRRSFALALGRPSIASVFSRSRRACTSEQAPRRSGAGKH